jgi:hypothetical protein
MPQPQVGYSAAQGSPTGWRPMGGPGLGTPPQAGPSPYGALVSLRGGPATGVPHIVCFRSSTNDCPASCEFELTGSTCLWQQLYWDWSSNSNLEYFEEERKCPSQNLSCFSDLNSRKIGRWNVGSKIGWFMKHCNRKVLFQAGWYDEWTPTYNCSRTNACSRDAASATGRLLVQLDNIYCVMVLFWAVGV